MLLLDVLGAVQASSAATVSVDSDNAGTSGEVGRLQGQYLLFASSITKVFLVLFGTGLGIQAGSHITLVCLVSSHGAMLPGLHKVSK